MTAATMSDEPPSAAAATTGSAQRYLGRRRAILWLTEDFGVCLTPLWPNIDGTWAVEFEAFDGSSPEPERKTINIEAADAQQAILRATLSVLKAAQATPAG